MKANLSRFVAFKLTAKKYRNNTNQIGGMNPINIAAPRIDASSPGTTGVSPI